MYLTILRLLLRTRFTRAYLAFLVLIGVIDSLTLIPVLTGSTSTIGTEELFFGVFIYFMIFSLLVLMGNGLSFTKPDIDFLLPSSTPGNDMAYASFTSQFVSFGVLFIILSIGYAAIFGNNTGEILMFVGAYIMLSLALTAMSVVVTDMSMAPRIAIFSGSALYLLSFLIGFNYSPFAVLTGHLVGGTIGSAIFMVVPLYFAVRWMRSETLTSKPPSRLIRRKETYKDSVRFSGLTPRGAVFRNYFLHAYLGNAVNTMGANISMTRRVRLSAAIKVMMAISVAYGAMLYYAELRYGGSDIMPFVLISMFYIIMFPQMSLFSTTFSVERVWLSATSMPFSTYIQTFVYAQMTQAFVLELPFAASLATLGILFQPQLLYSLIMVMAVSPLAVGVLAVMGVRSRQPQVQENFASPRRMGLRRMIAVGPYTLLVITGTVASILYPLASLAVIGASAAILLLILYPGRRWEKYMSKLVELSFI